MNKQRVAFVFPGQGSQVVGMGLDLAQAYPIARSSYEQADTWMDFPLSRMAWEGPEEQLNDTINTQPALLVHSVAAWEVLQQEYPQIKPAFVAGHSMGELSALVASGALPYPYALKLVRRRGELMKQAGEVSPGGMAAILGVEIPTIEQVCAQASAQGEIVQVANDNCPGQVVISGARDALERALVLAQQAGARRARALAVSIAAHSPLMARVQEEFNIAIGASPISDPLVPIVGNVTASPLISANEIRLDLLAQLTSRVRWTESIQWMVSQGVQTIIELGSGTVLAGLIKRIDESVSVISIGSPADLEKIRYAV
jgi:[acyl-carrier-protein] S-malonyltransferase